MNSQTKEERYKKALKEVYVILKNLTEELYARIPKGFIHFIEQNMEKEYEVNNQTLKEKGALPETSAILSLIYRDYLCNAEMKKQLTDLDNQEIAAEEKSYQDIFKKENNILNDIETMQEEKSLMIVQDKKWYYKLFEKIKKIFKR